MKRIAILVMMAVLVAIMGTPSANGTIAFSQVVYLRSDPTDHQGYVRSYRSFPDGWKNCSSPPPSSNQCTAWPYPRSGGNIRIVPLTYKLKEGVRRKDYYLIDLTVSTEDRFGSKDHAYLDVTVKGASPVRAATYSLGKGTVDGCKRYPIDIALGWGPIAGGTQVGTFNVDCHDTSISRQPITGGQKYHVTNLNAVKSVTFQRFVVVDRGQTPKFTYTVSWPTDSCDDTWASNGSQMVHYYWCTNSSASLTRTIGTTG